MFSHRLTSDTALAKKATVVVAEVKKVAAVATMIVCVSLLCTVFSPSRSLDCLNVLINTNISSTPIPITTNVVMIVSKLNV